MLCCSSATFEGLSKATSKKGKTAQVLKNHSPAPDHITGFYFDVKQRFGGRQLAAFSIRSINVTDSY
jgi:hypothetical protein